MIEFIEVPATQVFRGFIGIDGVTVEVQFTAPVNASVAEKDAAFVAALAQKADIEYLPGDVLAETPAVEGQAISEHEYAANGVAECPVCRDTDPQGESFDVVDGKVEQEMTCTHCDAKWTAIYHLSGYSQLEMGESNHV